MQDSNELKEDLLQREWEEVSMKVMGWQNGE